MQVWHVVRELVPRDADAVTGTMVDVLTEPGLLVHQLRGLVGAGHRVPGYHLRRCRFARLGRCLERTDLDILARLPDEERSLVLDDKSIQAHDDDVHHPVTLFKRLAGSRPGSVRRRGVLSAQRHQPDFDALLREAAPPLLHDQAGDLEVERLHVHPRLHQLHVLVLPEIGQRRGIADDVQLFRVLHLPHVDQERRDVLELEPRCGCLERGGTMSLDRNASPRDPSLRQPHRQHLAPLQSVPRPVRRPWMLDVD